MRASLRPAALAAALAGLAAAPLVAVPEPASAACAQSFAAPTVERELVGLINAQRSAAGLRPLSVHRTLRGVARRHSRAMSRGGWFEHSPGFGWAGGRAAGENLALAPTPQLALMGMMESAPHLRNMLDPAWRFIGVGAASDCQGGSLYTIEMMAERPS